MLKDILAKELLKGRFWTDAWSLVDGCTPISPGCAHCWLAGMAKRFNPHLIDRFTGHFDGTIVERPNRLEIPLRKRKPRVFAVWSDLFHEGVSANFITLVRSSIFVSFDHYFLLITKRPERVLSAIGNRPLENVIILITMENQEMADKRLPYIGKLALQGWQVGILAEPLLGPIKIEDSVSTYLASWLICGPETGPSKRPFREEWAKDLRDQCAAAGVPFMLKKGTINGVEYKEVPNI